MSAAHLHNSRNAVDLHRLAVDGHAHLNRRVAAAAVFCAV